MAAYACLISLNHIIHEIHCNPSLPISLHKQQLQSLTQKVNSLLEFLEVYDSPFDYTDEADPLEIRIVDAAHAAEDAIESFVVDAIHLAAATTQDHDEHMSHLYADLDTVIEQMDLLEKEAAKMVEGKAADEARAGSRSTSRKRKSPMLGFDEVLSQLMDKLIGYTNRLIIPIVGMGGIGKTTLASNVFDHRVVKGHFAVCVWVTISQDYNVGQILEQVLSQVIRDSSGGELGSSGKSDEDLRDELHRCLYGRRYLIVMDDMWNIEAWEKMKFSFPDYNNGSRILVTTRMSKLASQLTDSNSLIDMRFLDKDSSWDLFSQTVYGKEAFPPQLKKIGQKIVEKCNGLPLAIVVIGGLLSKSQHTEYWEQIERNLGSIVNSKNEGHCLKILRMSYTFLPAYLKPCFLYMGVFEEDKAIRVSTLIHLWVSEGFLKPASNKSSETVAGDYLQELVDRNLILVHELGVTGNMKYCKVHDLLRDLSLKEAQKQRFYHVLRQNSPRGGTNSQRRIVIPQIPSEVKVLYSFSSVSRARSYVCYSLRVTGLSDFRLLRILHAYDRNAYVHNEYSLRDVFGFVNLRYLAIRADSTSEVPSSISLLWNLHVLIISSRGTFTAPMEIWKMCQLRHVECTSGTLRFPDTPVGCDDSVIMENLHTLIGLDNFYLNEEVVKRVPNVKKLAVRYVGKLIERVDCLTYLQCLSKLETFRCSTEYSSDVYLHKVSFPDSIKKLTVNASFDFELNDDILGKIGSLPLLEKLILQNGFFDMGTWETKEGQFRRLKSLTVAMCGSLEKWMVLKSSHFPRLVEVRLYGLSLLEEVPFEIGNISTLKMIVMENCSESAMMSAARIVRKQEKLQGEELDFDVRVVYKIGKAPAMQFLEPNPNFLVSEL